MSRFKFFAAAFCGLSLSGAKAHAAPEIVVAMRYLQPSTTSHAHIYLFREDGKLLRQLTRSNVGQDKSPLFAPDGYTIVWTREKPGDVKEYWSIEPRGGNMHRLKAAPKWYTSPARSPFFTNLDPPKGVDALDPEEGDKAPVVRAPDGSVELVLREDLKDESDGWDGPGHGSHYLLRDVKTGQETAFGKLPGFYGVYDLLHDKATGRQHFLSSGSLRLAFFDLHLDSSAGDTTFALDLKARRLVRLSPNWAAPVPLPGQSAFLTLTYNRYVPIKGSKKTANCSYIEHWDANLKKIRYGRSDAAVCYGASMYRPDMTPRIVSIRADGGD